MRVLNYKFQSKDERDHVYKSYKKTASPPFIDLEPNCPPIMDQGQFGTCTAHSASFSLHYCIKREKSLDYVPSRLFIYANARNIGGYPLSEDSGATLRDTWAGIKQFRDLNEVKWPYNPSVLLKVQPPANIYSEAAAHKLFQYQSVPQTLQAIQSCLEDGYPISFGITVYSSFMTEEVMQTGIVPMPNLAVEQVVGGHAITLIGYDNRYNLFKFANSWGTGVGQKGYFQIPYAYILDPSLAGDFWTPRVFY